MLSTLVTRVLSLWSRDGRPDAPSPAPRDTDAGTTSRHFASFDALRFSALDVKVGFRMLVRYPGLTLVAGVAIAFAVAVGTATFEFLTQMTHPTLPLPDGQRIVGLQNWNADDQSADMRLLHDLEVWRKNLKSVTHLGGYRTVRHNLVIGQATLEPVAVAEMSAAGFSLTQVAPLLGRWIVEDDERPSALPVVVIGYHVWQQRFGGDQSVLGRIVRLDNTPTTIVGVMPAGYAFPVAHEFWTPLRLQAGDYAPREGPEIAVFGRLAPGATLARAGTELTALGARIAATIPGAHRELRPQVLQYAAVTSGISGSEALMFMSINIFFVMLIVLVCANVALLMFARSATREVEMTVRTALGATRSRIVMQLFAEALVLGGASMLVGLGAAHATLGWWLDVSRTEAGGQLPFWFSDKLSPTTVLYAGMLTLLGAVIAGVLPALKVTARGIETRLRQVTAGGGGGLRLGHVWTAVIVTQVAITVAFPAGAFFVRRYVVQFQHLDAGFSEQHYLSAQLELDREPLADVAGDSSRAASVARARRTYEDLDHLVSGEPGVTGVTFVDRLPRTHHPPRQVEVEGLAVGPADAAAGSRVSPAFIADDYFDVLDAPLVAGRAFRASDTASNAHVAIVNRSFVQRVMGGRNPVGRRIRYLAEHRTGDEPAGPWFEIVGVARDLGTVADNPNEQAGVYHPLVLGGTEPLHMIVHLRQTPTAFVPRLRAVAASVSPVLRLDELLPLDAVSASMWMEFNFLFKVLLTVSSIALLLSLAGIYAVMSFAVARRTREIGIRVALGATPRSIFTAIFARPLLQVAVGVVAGGGLTGTLALGVMGGLSTKEAGMVLAYGVLMMTVCMLACIVPTRRALGVQPTEALRGEA